MAPVQSELSVIELEQNGFDVAQVESFVKGFCDSKSQAELEDIVESLDWKTATVVQKVLEPDYAKRIAIANANKIIDILGSYAGLDIKLKGTWVWIGGETKTHKEVLKMLKCRWSKDKQKWIWKSKVLPNKQGRPASMRYINRTYGIQRTVVGTDPTPDNT